MRKAFKVFKIILGALMMLSAAGILVWVKWWHIDMTHRRQIIEFYPHIFIASIGIVIGYLTFLSGARR